MSRKRPRKWKEDESIDKDSLDRGAEENVEKKEQKREEYDAFGFMKDKKQVAAVAGAFFIVGFLMSWFVNPSLTAQVIGSGMTASVDDVGQDVIDYINENLLREGFTATLVEITEDNGMYEVSVDIKEDEAETGQEVKFYVSGNGELLFFNEPVDMTESVTTPEEPEQEPDTEFPKRDKPENTNIKTFFDSGEDICYEDGKPIIRMYASSGCGYCGWNKPMYEKVVKEYMDQGKIVAYLWENGKNILSDEQEAQPPEEAALYQKYRFGGVPSFIFGCKYYRGGASFSRVENGTELEEAELRTVIEDLLGE